MIEIKRWDHGNIIHSGEFETVRECLEDGVARGISFAFVNLTGAELTGANLTGAELTGAVLTGAVLNRAEPPNMSVSIPAGEEYYLFISPDVVQAGRESYSPAEWRAFTKEQITDMDGRRALKFYPRLLDLMDFFLGKGERPEWVQENNND